MDPAPQGCTRPSRHRSVGPTAPETLGRSALARSSALGGDVVGVAGVPEDRFAGTVEHLEPQARAVGARLWRTVPERPGHLDHLPRTVRGLVGRGGHLEVGSGAARRLPELACLDCRRRAPRRWWNRVRGRPGRRPRSGGRRPGVRRRRWCRRHRRVSRCRRGGRRRALQGPAGVGRRVCRRRGPRSREHSYPRTVRVSPHPNGDGHSQHRRHRGGAPGHPPSLPQALPAADHAGQQLLPASPERLSTSLHANRRHLQVDVRAERGAQRGPAPVQVGLDAPDRDAQGAGDLGVAETGQVAESQGLRWRRGSVRKPALRASRSVVASSGSSEGATVPTGRRRRVSSMARLAATRRTQASR